MKKFVALMLALVMVLALCACGNNNNKDNDSDASAKLKILDSEYVTEDYAIGIAKENTALLEKVNAALKELKDDGTLKAVIDYFISGTGTLPEVQQNVAADAEELVMATNATFPPYESVDGDKIVVHPQQTADNGQIVVALLGDEATVKRLKRQNGEVWLMPENPAYAPIDGREAQILGRVKAVIREY